MQIARTYKYPKWSGRQKRMLKWKMVSRRAIMTCGSGGAAALWHSIKMSALFSATTVFPDPAKERPLSFKRGLSS
jgi:hypothetical protein